MPNSLIENIGIININVNPKDITIKKDIWNLITEIVLSGKTVKKTLLNNQNQILAYMIKNYYI